MNEASITLRAESARWPEVYNFITGRLSEDGCPEETANIIAIVSEEIFVNVASYAYEEGGGAVEIRLEKCLSPRGAALTFIDGGRPYNPLEKPDPDLGAGLFERKVGGLGVYLMKKNMDEVRYTYDEGKNILTIIKYY